MKTILLTVSLTLISLLSFGQEEESSPYLKVHSFQVMSGLTYPSFSFYQEFETFKMFSTDQSIFDGGLADLETADQPNFPIMQSYFEANMGMITRNKQGNYRKNTELIIGLGYGQIEAKQFSFGHHENYRIDTISASQSNNAFYVDSIYGYYQLFTHHSKMAFFNLKHIYKSDPNKRIYIYGGGGINLGFGLNPTLKSYYRESWFIDPYDRGDGTSKPNSHTAYEESKTVNAHAIYLLAAQFKTGLNFRFSNQHNFWKHWNMFLEGTLSVEHLHLSPIHTRTSPNLHLQAGLKYTFKELS